MSEWQPPPPIPSYESLTAAGDAIPVAENVRLMCRLIRTGEDEAALIYQVREGVHDVLRSRRIRKAFSSWPPELEDAVEHQRGDFMNMVSEVSTCSDGTFCIRTREGWIHAAAGEPGARFRVPGQAFPDLDAGMYVLTHEGGINGVVHRSARAEQAHVVPCGKLPAEVGVGAALAVPGGLLLAAMKQVAERRTRVQLFKASPAGVVAGTALDHVGAFRHIHAVRRPGGGAFIVLPSMDAVWIYAVGDDGQQIGEAWRYSGEGPRDNVLAAAPWARGVSLVTVPQGVGVVLFDGQHATYSKPAQQDARIMSDQRAGITSSADGRTLLVSYIDQPHSRLTRFVCESGDPANVYRPQRRAPVPSRAPGAVRAVPSPFGTADEILRSVRQRQLASVFHSIRSDYSEAAWRGDATAGSYVEHNGEGDFFIIGWSPEGVVALGFDHESPESEWSVPKAERDPLRHLRQLPADLKPLAAKTAELVESLATEGFWVSAGAEPAHGSSRLERLSGLRKSSNGGRRSDAIEDELGNLASRLSRSASATLDANDTELLLTEEARSGEVLDPSKVERAAEALSRLGVSWPGAVEAARARADQEQRQRDERLAPADRDLFTAAYEGGLDAAQRALASGAEIDCRLPEGQLPWTPEGMTPLMVALHRGHADLASYLIDQGAGLEHEAPGWGGMVYALRLAAERGYVELCRTLLARGASVRPEVASWGILQQICYANRRGEPAVPADYAAILELLLDAGAPLPNDAHCDMLVKLAEAAGATQLVPRLRRNYANDELPDAPAAIDVAAHAPRISALLEQAAKLLPTDSSAALKLLVEAWQLSLHPRIADVAERLAHWGAGSPFNYFVPARGGIDGEASYAALVAARDQPPDPRAGRVILKYLSTADIYTKPTWLAKCDDASAALLVRNRDIRVIDGLTDHCANRRPVSSNPVRASLITAKRMLEEVVPGVLGDPDVQHLEAIERYCK